MKKLLMILMMGAMPFVVSAQGNGKGKGHGKHGKVKHTKVMKTKEYRGYRVKGGPPAWAPAHGYRAKQHVYFPDYYTFYDPNRNGYVYWGGNGWQFSPSTPGFLNGVNLGAARMQLMNDVPLATRPEVYYDRYSSTYPARAVNINVNIPRP
jgi:hypothetical protein